MKTRIEVKMSARAIPCTKISVVWSSFKAWASVIDVIVSRYSYLSGYLGIIDQSSTVQTSNSGHVWTPSRMTYENISNFSFFHRDEPAISWQTATWGSRHHAVCLFTKRIIRLSLCVSRKSLARNNSNFKFYDWILEWVIKYQDISDSLIVKERILKIFIC